MTIVPLAAATRPTRPLPRTPQYRYVACDFYTGAPRVDLPLTGVRFNEPLSDTGQFTGTLQLPPVGTATMYAASTPNASGLRVDVDGQHVWNGVIAARRPSSDSDGGRVYGSYEITAFEWGAWLDWILNSPDPTDPATMGTLDYVQTDVLQIPRSLIAWAQDVDRGGPGILLDNAVLSGRLVDRTYYWYEATPFSQRLADLVDDTGDAPEWFFEAATVAGRPMRRFVIDTEISRPVEQSGLRFTYVSSGVSQPWPLPPAVVPLDQVGDAPQPQPRLPGAGGNVVEIPDIQEDGTTSATAVLAVGAGQDESTLWAIAFATDLYAAGWPLKWKVVSYKDVDDQAVLQSHADADLAACRGLVTSMQLTTRGDDPKWWLARRGDWALITLDLPELSPRPKSYRARVLDREVTPSPDGGPERVVWTFAQTAEVTT